MRYVFVLIVGIVLGSLVQFIAKTQPPAAQMVAPATRPAAGDTAYFTERMKDDRVAHFRLRILDKEIGERTHTDGRLETVKTYHRPDDIVADIFVRPADEQLAVAQHPDGRRFGVYLRNLRFEGDHALADVQGTALNFGMKGANNRVGGGQEIARNGTVDKPNPVAFKPGIPVERDYGSYGWGRHDGPMGKDYTVRILRGYSIELVGITTVADVVKDQGGLDRVVPPAAQAEVTRDMTPATRPADAN